MKKSRVFILVLVICGIAAYFTYHRLMDSKEAFLDNRFYQTELDSIRQIRRKLVKQHAGKKELRAAFVRQITRKVFPYWYGTKWDYNGTTEMPHQGSIACGYFVTTTLRDMGVPINRVKMAQCASEEMIRSLVSKSHIHHLSGMPLSEFETRISKQGNGLYIIGLDNHTGFIFIEGTEHFFIHSTGWFPFKVVKDKISESSVLSKSKYRVVGKVSDDDIFLKKWVQTD